MLYLLYTVFLQARENFQIVANLPQTVEFKGQL